jgi:hypothetical protein
VRADDTDPLSLTESLESPVSAPAGRADIATLQKLQERTLRNRTRLLDRFHQMPLYGKAREKMNTPKAKWAMDGCPSDHPIVQMILSLRNEEEELAKMDHEGAGVDWKDWYKVRLTVKSKIADLLLALQKENDKVYDELMQIIVHDQQITQHADKMAIASGKKDEDASDADLIAKAKRLGLPLNGDPA